MDTIIIKACLNGGRGRDANPNVPWTPEEVAQEAIRCYEAGACIVHVHARTPDGGVSYDPGWYAETCALIRAQCDLVMNHTTARRSGIPVEAVTRYLLETPHPVEMVSLNLGQGVRWVSNADTGQRQTTVSPNSYEDIVATLEACYKRGTFPEPAVHDTGMLNNAITLINEGHIKSSRYFLVEPSAHWGDGRQSMVGSPRNYFMLTDNIREFYPDATWLAHSSGSQTFVIAGIAVATGAHIRVGMEDSPFL
ncbi:MAG: 3-keto-5-aminohexanoate cleavage protein, partial [Chloroflexi bacterium]|nr:3-keto-5-aminohexanoate cleavage protein [Chloroflexota bacterium]